MIRPATPADVPEILAMIAELAAYEKEPESAVATAEQLEAALFGCPMVIAYAMPGLTHWLMRRKALLPWIGLPNILCQAAVVPEFIQDQATPAALADALMHWLNAPHDVATLRERFAQLHAELAQDTPRLACDAIEATLAGTAQVTTGASFAR